MTDISSTRKKIIELLKTIYDPEIFVNIWDLGLVYAVDVDDQGNVVVIMTLTSPNCPVIDILPNQIEETVGALEEVAEASVQLIWDPPWDKSMMSEEAKLDLGWM